MNARSAGNIRFMLLLGLIAFAGMLAVLATARWGIGTQPDSASYLGAARQLLAGKGLTLPSALGGSAAYQYFAPLYPVLLALTSFGRDPAEAVLWQNMLLMGANILLVGAAAYASTGGSRTAALVASLLTLGAVDVLRGHSVALTEPVFLACCLLCWLLLGRYLVRERVSDLVLAGLAAALAFLLRFSAAGLVAAMVIGILVLGRQSVTRRLRDGLLFGIISALPALLWIMSQSGDGGMAAGRAFSVHLITPAKLAVGAFTVLKWVLPEDLIRWLASGVLTGRLESMFVAALLAGLAVVLLLATFRSLRLLKAHSGAPPSIRSHTLPALLLIFSTVYILFLIFSISFLDAYTHLEERQLLVPHVAMLVVLVYGFHHLLRAPGLAPAASYVLRMGAVLLIVSYGAQAIIQTANDYRDGVSFARVNWRQSETLAFVDSLPPDTLLYSNNPEVIYLRLNRLAARLPRRYDFTSLKPNPNVQADILAMQRALADRQGYVVFFQDRTRDHIVDEDDLRQVAGLRPVQTFSDGVIYAP